MYTYPYLRLLSQVYHHYNNVIIIILLLLSLLLLTIGYVSISVITICISVTLLQNYIIIKKLEKKNGLRLVYIDLFNNMTRYCVRSCLRHTGSQRIRSAAPMAQRNKFASGYGPPELIYACVHLALF